jgi:hypothetical protein
MKVYLHGYDEDAIAIWNKALEHSGYETVNFSAGWFGWFRKISPIAQTRKRQN